MTHPNSKPSVGPGNPQRGAFPTVGINPAAGLLRTAASVLNPPPPTAGWPLAIADCGRNGPITGQCESPFKNPPTHGSYCRTGPGSWAAGCRGPATRALSPGRLELAQCRQGRQHLAVIRQQSRILPDATTAIGQRKQCRLPVEDPLPQPFGHSAQYGGQRAEKFRLTLALLLKSGNYPAVW